MTISTLLAMPSRFENLTEGLYFVPSDHVAFTVRLHHDVPVMFQYDTRGGEYAFHLTIVSWFGNAVEFNEYDEGRVWIDEKLGIDVDKDFDPVREWGVR